MLNKLKFFLNDPSLVKRNTIIICQTASKNSLVICPTKNKEPKIIWENLKVFINYPFLLLISIKMCVVWVEKIYILNMLPSSNWRSEFKFTDILLYNFWVPACKVKRCFTPINKQNIIFFKYYLFSNRICSVNTLGPLKVNDDSLVGVLGLFKNYHPCWRGTMVII